MGELVLRFAICGIVVSLFAVLGEILRPRIFAGLFGAAPSIALATLGLVVHKHGNEYAALESQSMIWGASALFRLRCCLEFCLTLVYLLDAGHDVGIAAGLVGRSCRSISSGRVMRCL